MNVKKKVEFRKPHQGCGSRHSSKPIPTIRKDKGICYHCDEKFTHNHKCKIQKLFWVEGLLEEEVVDSATIEVHKAGSGEAQEDDVLIDSGSTHNFIDHFLIKKTNLPSQSDAMLEVMVTNGKRLKGNRRCRGLFI
ncbi:hypothetical protein AMTRI_Chr06g198010 [Amborella trichopoda]